MAPRNTYAQRFYEAALEFFESGQYAKALDHIQKAIAKAPSNADYVSTKGVFLHKMNDLAGAIEAYREAIQINPQHTFAHFNLGLILMKLGKITEAINEWEAVIRINPRDVDAIFNIAVALAQTGRRREAIPFFEKVLQLKPEHVQAHQNLGIIYRDEHQFDKARHHLRRLRELDSTYSEVVSTEIARCDEQEFLARLSQDNLGRIAREVAGGAAGKAGAGAPDSGGPVAAALVALINEDFGEALRLAEQALAAAPDDSQALLLRGQARFRLGQHQDAIADFQAVAQAHPDSAEAFFHLGTVYLALGELEAALENFQRVARLEPTYPLIEDNIASIEEKLRNR
ncbi:MAG: TPR repeat protein [Candidatus Ozemobacter sibiricus]|jgi:tetratricopeptide (TPR) repeat protein|uniref:TPR repeat protein n=1 Tax=Candidatus Ozemobacter sibiricus TaxID=2268124 RepID=A0A367ZSK9_9BACT|nr:MAG: TPR repeat protein [Candidatus Ozemobacter sibiricus]